MSCSRCSRTTTTEDSTRSSPLPSCQNPRIPDEEKTVAIIQLFHVPSRELGCCHGGLLFHCLLQIDGRNKGPANVTWHCAIPKATRLRTESNLDRPGVKLFDTVTLCNAVKTCQPDQKRARSLCTDLAECCRFAGADYATELVWLVATSRLRNGKS